MIERLIIRNYKGIKEADICFRSDSNVIVGNNGVGKSTIIEALTLALGYGLNQLEIVPSIFNIDSIKQYELDKVLPEIIIEVYFEGKNTEFSGKNNLLHENSNGIQLKMCFDEDSFADLYEKEKDRIKQIPCEYYKIERNWFSDKKVIQRLIPYSILIVDSSSSYFNSSSNNYVSSLVRKYLGDEDSLKIKTCLRQLRDDFERNEKLKDVNTAIEKKNKDLKVSIDVTSNIITRNIISPLFKDIPVEQIGAGDLCVLKTMLSLERNGDINKKKVVIIEEPESHLSHTKMYELLNKIKNTIDNDTQLIITTHNNFIANKLNLKNLLLISNNNYKVSCKSIEENSNEAAFFTKISNYPTLRLILCKSAILVEGPTDEMIVTYYYHKKYSCHPFDDGIELISVEGVGFKAYANLAKTFGKKIAILTDNDKEKRDDLIRQRGLENMPDHIQIFTDEDTDNNTTIEPSFINANKKQIQSLSDAVRSKKIKKDTPEDLALFMKNNKTEWAYRILSNIDENNFEIPQYIKDSIDWIRNEQ